jgi:hypothetical protein
VASFVVCGLLAPRAASAQVTSPSTTPAQADTTQLSALIRYPAFFHNRTVIIQGTVRMSGRDTWIESSPDVRVRVVNLAGVVDGRRIQIRGRFFDVGRLPVTDSRILHAGLDAALLRSDTRAWPRPGELLVLAAERAAAYAASPGQPSILDVVLDPDRLNEQGVMITGQFRGRNLVSDQPASPGHDRWEFVLRNGTSSVWIIGRRPQGPDFNFDPDSPRNVGPWLRVSGVVRRFNGLVAIEADAIERGDSEPEGGTAANAQAIPPLPPPEVLFSVPTAGETDVSSKTTVRVQFSRIMNADTFAGHVTVSYVGEGLAGAPPPRAPEFVAAYVAKDQLLLLTFKTPLERFRRVSIELHQGIATPDGAALPPWSITFTTGDR